MRVEKLNPDWQWTRYQKVTATRDNFITSNEQKYWPGLDGEPFDRNNVFVSIENRIKQITSDPIITVHLVAAPDVIRKRMSVLKNNPEHTNSPLCSADIEDVMSDYEYFINKSDIGPVVKVNTSIDSPDDTLKKVVDLLQPHLTKMDLERIEDYKAGQ